MHSWTAYRPCQSLLQEGPPHCPPPYWGSSWCSSAGRTAGQASLHYPHLLSQLHLQFLSIAQPQSSTKDVRTEQPVGHWTGETICRLFAGSSVLVINQTVVQLLVFIRRISTVYTINTYMHCICVCTVWSFMVVKYWYMHVILLKLTGAQYFVVALKLTSSFFQAFVE